MLPKWYDIIRYDIYVMQLGVHPLAVVGKLVKKIKIKKRQLYTRGETVHKRTQKHRYTK